MAGIGIDIAEVMEELGVTVTILRTPTNLTEKITYDINEQATNAFVREFLLRASFAYNTKLISGDLIQFNNQTFLVVNKTPDTFEGAVVEYAASIYKCNLAPWAYFTSPSETKDPVTFQVTQGWVTKKDPAYGLIYRGTRTALLNSEVSEGKETAFELLCIVSDSYGIEPNDRLVITPTEYFRVQDVEKYAFPGVHLLTLVTDDRPAP